MDKKFIGRRREIKKMGDLWRRPAACLVVINGRRRIGKSRLAAEFAKGKRFISITGLPPDEGTTEQNQRDAFASQLVKHSNLPPIFFKDWLDAFYTLSQLLTDEPTVILFDEISWMGSLDPTFIGKLKIWWDTEISQRSKVILIFCGSVSTWIEENIIKGTAFFGRISLTLTLEPFTIRESAAFLRQIGFKGTAQDIYKVLAVTGGIPWYLEQILPHYTADQNVQRLCFEQNGILVTEFNNIFHDLFDQKGALYQQIMEALAIKMDSVEGIRQVIDYPRGGTFSHLIDHLVTAGFVSRHPQWSIKTGKIRRQSLYRICDPYSRFYFKAIYPHLDQIQKGQKIDVPHVPGYESLMGLQIESLLLQNRQEILAAIDVNPIDIVYENPYVQKASTREKGCQIDYLIQTRTNTLYVCEFKFRKRELKKEIISEIEEKINRISAPKGFSRPPVLFHIGGVSDEFYDTQFFYRIVDIADFLEGEV
jgi:uncharacterized protein